MVLVILLALGLVASSCGLTGSDELEVGEADGGSEADYLFVIPAGSGEAIDRGEPLEILPGSLEVEVGEVIEIVNEDDRGHLVGPFFVGANETMRQEFTSRGEYVGICTVHPSGEITVTVT